MSEDITQEYIDEGFVELKSVWDNKVAESGLREAMFIITDQTGWVSQFLSDYDETKNNVESLGLTMPELVPGLVVNISPIEDETSELRP